MPYLGIDVGGTNLAAGIVSEAFQVVGRRSAPTPRVGTGEDLADAMAQLVRDLLVQEGLTLQDLSWVGVGSAGYIDASRGVNCLAANLLGGLVNDPTAPNLERRLGVPVYLCNDGDAAAYGESIAGAARGSRSSLTVTLGTGVGAGMIVRGMDDFLAREVGHHVICQDGAPCTCGHRGCWEAYASVTALIRQTREAMEANPGSALWQVAGSLEAVGGRTVFDACALGDPVAQEVLDRYIGYVSRGLANLINILEPEVICIGGGISAQGETLLAPLRQRLRQDVFLPQVVDRTRVVAAALGNEAGIIGAALLGRLLK